MSELLEPDCGVKASIMAQVDSLMKHRRDEEAVDFHFNQKPAAETVQLLPTLYPSGPPAG